MRRGRKRREKRKSESLVLSAVIFSLILCSFDSKFLQGTNCKSEIFVVFKWWRMEFMFPF